MKPIGARVRLSCRQWLDDPPRRGDALQTPTGRTYKVIAFKGSTLICRIVSPDAKIRGCIFDIAWAPRGRSKRSRAPVL